MITITLTDVDVKCEYIKIQPINRELFMFNVVLKKIQTADVVKYKINTNYPDLPYIINFFKHRYKK